MQTLSFNSNKNFAFYLTKKSAAECHHLLGKAYRKHASSLGIVQIVVSTFLKTSNFLIRMHKVHGKIAKKKKNEKIYWIKFHVKNISTIRIFIKMLINQLFPNV